MIFLNSHYHIENCRKKFILRLFHLAVLHQDEVQGFDPVEYGQSVHLTKQIPSSDSHLVLPV